jgi:flagellar biosynthesis protein FlhF
LLSHEWISEIHLVLTAGIGYSELRQVMEGFGRLKIDRIAWTKLDEAITFGSLFNAQLLAQAPLSYLCAGQKVPEDLEAATPERITRLLLSVNKTKR